MVYQSKFVAVVKHNGKVLRERDNIVYLPFGSEFTLLLKNLNTRPAQVRISIDGQDALSGHSLIVAPNSDMEIERFFNGNHCEGNRFKFIQKTERISEYRGDRVDDGIVRIEYCFEAPASEVRYIDTFQHYHYNFYWPKRFTYWDYSPTLNPVYGTFASSMSGHACGGTVSCANNMPDQFNQLNQDEGIVVPGSKSNQKFDHGYIGALERNKEVIILNLRGFMSSEPVKAPITVKTRITCPTCGKASDFIAKFCVECGTAIT